MPRVLDVQLYDLGSAVALAPLTLAGQEYLETEAGRFGGWLGGSLHLPRKVAANVVECMTREGYGVTQ